MLGVAPMKGMKGAWHALPHLDRQIRKSVPGTFIPNAKMRNVAPMALMWHP